MTADKEPLYWTKDKSWWVYKDGKYYLTDKAPERAKKSFELWSNPPKNRNL